MITLFVSPQSNSSRKARAWLEDHHLAFSERNVANSRLTFAEFKQILYLTENGTKGSKAYKRLKARALNDDLLLKELLGLINQNPSLLRYPLIVDEQRLQIGYNVDNIRQFIPREVRILELQAAQFRANVA